MDQAKIKVSVTLAPDVLRAVDEAASHHGTTRSSVIESWLRRANRQEQEARLRADAIAYYQSLTKAACEEDRAVARASSRAARRLRIDE